MLVMYYVISVVIIPCGLHVYYIMCISADVVSDQVVNVLTHIVSHSNTKVYEVVNYQCYVLNVNKAESIDITQEKYSNSWRILFLKNYYMYLFVHQKGFVPSHYLYLNSAVQHLTNFHCKQSLLKCTYSACLNR